MTLLPVSLGAGVLLGSCIQIGIQSDNNEVLKICQIFIKLFYKKKYLPVLVQDKSENFRKIRDHENNTGWIHISQLSKKKAAITIDDDQLIFNKPSIYSKPFAILKKGRLCKIHKCKDEWCKISVEKYKGWVKKNILWGLL